MNNKLFISRCETLLTTMRAGNCLSVTTKQIAKWLNIEESSASQFVAKLCKYNFLNKKGAASKTRYELTSNCHNSLEQAINTKGNINTAVTYVVDWFVNKQSKISARKVTSVNGKEFVKVQSSEELDSVSKQAIDNLLTVIKQNEDMKETIKLLEMEVERLKPFEEYYKKVTSVKV